MEVNISCLFVIVVTCILEASCSNHDKPYVNTKSGGVKGYYKTSYEGRRFAAFEGIPYALAPIGERRFQPPIPIATWSKDIEAVTLPKPCLQVYAQTKEILGVEDCLYLNIYSPAENETDNFPVIFWIHGGGFQYGTSSNYGAKYLMDKDLILVTINYRVGPFGFLSTGDDVVPGNMGLKDQSLALKWIANNIRLFGGDPKRITLAGVSAGGASVHHHYLSPLSAGLFRNGISFSGTALARWAYTNDTSNVTRNLAAQLNCLRDDTAVMIRCLKDASAEDLINATRQILSQLYFSYVLFPPVAEKIKTDYFINDSPENIIRNKKAYDAPWIAGVVKEEGLYITAGFALKEDMIVYTNENWETVASYMLHLKNNVPEEKHAYLAKLAKKHYFGERPFSTDRKDVNKLTHLTGDDQIVTGAIRAAKLQANVHKSPVWFYFYTYRAAQSFSDHLANTTENLGVSHDDDIYIVLENKYINPTTTEKDKAMLHEMLNFWYSVASDGKPNLPTSWANLNAAREFQYMHIAGPGNFTMKSNNNLGEVLFWNRIGL